MRLSCVPVSCFPLGARPPHRATHDAQVNEAREKADRVRHETRKEVRQEGLELYQGFRDALAMEEMEKQAADKKQIAENRATRMKFQKKRRSAIRNMTHGKTKAAKAALREVRAQDAEAVRQLKEAELERKRQYMMSMMQERRDKYLERQEWVRANTVELE